LAKFKVQAVMAPSELAFPEIKLDIDTPEDLNRLNRFVEKYAISTASSAATIVQAFNEFSNS
jgi:spore coat polysaccharide biosynthesis protein SpsF (cytidylyltransferase family)